MDKQLTYLIECTEEIKQTILDAERYLWKHPAPGFREWTAHQYMEKIFRDLGYELMLAGDIPGFYTILDTGRPGPTVCIFAELDSLINGNHPECDPESKAVHSCGHHMQCAGLIGLATILKRPNALDGMSGKIMLCAVPAEELIDVEYRQKLIEEGTIKYLTGKAEFMRRGYFKDVDIAFLVHAGNGNPRVAVADGYSGSLLKNAVFHGVAGHAAYAQNNVNALYAASQSLSACNALREVFGGDIKWSPIMTEGGSTVSATPDRVVLESMVRGSTLKNVIGANRKINRAIAGSAASMGATATISDQIGYAPTDCDLSFNELVCEVYERLFPNHIIGNEHAYRGGSTDIGFLTPMMVATPIVSGGGCSGNLHGSDFHIDDPIYATVNGTKLEAALLWELLKDDAKIGNQIRADFKPKYDSWEAYFAELDKLNMTREAVQIHDEETVQLHF